jgi:hypothetical protein
MPRAATGFFVLGCALLLAACGNMAAGPSSGSYASVDQLRACQDKPFYDTVSASDRRTVIKGMTPQEREVCTSIRSGHGIGGPGR